MRQERAPVVSKPVPFVRLVWGLMAALAMACSDDPSQPSQNTGRLTVVVSGLPAGVAADVQVDGPGNYAQLVPETRTFSQLTPGSYIVTARSVIDGAATYQPLPTTQTITLAADIQETATVTYAP